MSDEVAELRERVAKLEAKNGDLLEDLRNAVHDLAIKISGLEIKLSQSQSRWAVVADFGGKLLWIVVACWVLLKLGLTPPPVP